MSIVAPASAPRGATDRHVQGAAVAARPRAARGDGKRMACDDDPATDAPPAGTPNHDVRRRDEHHRRRLGPDAGERRGSNRADGPRCGDRPPDPHRVLGAHPACAALVAAPTSAHGRALGSVTEIKALCEQAETAGVADRGLISGIMARPTDHGAPWPAPGTAAVSAALPAARSAGAEPRERGDRSGDRGRGMRNAPPPRRHRRARRRHAAAPVREAARPGATAGDRSLEAATSPGRGPRRRRGGSFQRGRVVATVGRGEPLGRSPVAAADGRAAERLLGIAVPDRSAAFGIPLAQPARAARQPRCPPGLPHAGMFPREVVGSLRVPAAHEPPGLPPAASGSGGARVCPTGRGALSQRSAASDRPSPPRSASLVPRIGDFARSRRRSFSRRWTVRTGPSGYASGCSACRRSRSCRPVTARSASNPAGPSGCP